MNNVHLTRLTISLFDLMEETSDPVTLSVLQSMAHKLEAVLDVELARSLWSFAALKRQGRGVEAVDYRERVLSLWETGVLGDGAHDYAKAKRIGDLLKANTQVGRPKKIRQN